MRLNSLSEIPEHLRKNNPELEKLSVSKIQLSGNTGQLKRNHPENDFQLKNNKYHAKRTWSILCNREFASKAEASHGETLNLMERSGDISDLEYQVKFKLCDKPLITVTIDFSYKRNDITVFEDVKGVLTRDSRTKYAWLKEKHGVEVRLVKNRN